jgi:heptosyltransferase III
MSGQSHTMPSDSRVKVRLACLIAARNLGDTVVMSTFFHQLVRRGFADAYLVWTRPGLEFLFNDLPACEIVTSSFPVGTSKNFGGTAAVRFLQAAWLIRQRRPSVTVDLTGDVRERIFARLLGAPRHAHIGWADDHPYRRLIRNPLGSGHPRITVPARVTSVYAAYDQFLNALAPGCPGDAATAPAPKRSQAPEGGRMRVGIHPYASQASKLWPEENWRQLVAALLSQGIHVVAFAAPAERSALCALLADLRDQVELRTGTLEQFAKELRSVQLLVGLDSFAVHMAENRGVRTITINGGTPPGLWATPSGHMLASSGGCVHHPCFNIAPCRGRAYENACVRAISPSAVLADIEVTRKELGLS